MLDSFTVFWKRSYGESWLFLDKADLAKRVKIKFDHWLPRRLGADATTPSFTIYVAKNDMGFKLFRHELKHAMDILEIYEALWTVFHWAGLLYFHVRYRLEFVINLIKYKNRHDAYEAISYEVRARDYAESPATQWEYELYLAKRLEAIQRGVKKK